MDLAPIVCGNILVVPRISRRAKRVSLHVTAKKGVEVILPGKRYLSRAKEFIRLKEKWIEQQSRKFSARIILTHGTVIPLLGKPCTITWANSLRGVIRHEGESLYVPGLQEYIPGKVKNFLKERVKKEIEILARNYSREMGLTYQGITVRDPASRWGSCSRSGNLSFSWRLILAPREVLEYVVIHELAHRREMNHSPRFWKIVAQYSPGFQHCRRWLRQHGNHLHQYQ